MDPTHPERREPLCAKVPNAKWSNRDWGHIPCELRGLKPFHSIFGQHTIEHRMIIVDLQQIMFELISADQCYWIWASFKLPVIGDLSEARLFLHPLLPSYLTTRDKYRAERDSLPPKWKSFNMPTLGVLLENAETFLLHHI
jgi:hypothetical protein